MVRSSRWLRKRNYKTRNTQIIKILVFHLATNRQPKLSKVNLIKDKDKKITSKYIFRGKPCIQDKRSGKYIAFDNGEWLPIDERFLKDIKENL